MRSFKALIAVFLAMVFAVPVTAGAVSSQPKNAGSEIVNVTGNESEETTESTTTESSISETTEPTSETASSPTQPTAAPKRNGFVTENGRTRYYVNGVMKKGFVKIGKYYYYFDNNGYMVTGFRTIKKHRFYFAKNGHMVTGFRIIQKHRYYFRQNGWMVKGFKTIGKYRYYFNSKGYMLTGSRKIGKSYYYFLKNGRMKKGFWRKKGKLYYYSKINGKQVRGLYRIGKYTYCFSKKTGAAIKGFSNVKRKGKTYLAYFDKNYRMKKGTFKVGSMEYKSNKKSGIIYSYRNLANVLCQLPKLPTGCEITSWTMMANFAGVKIDKITAAKIMPKSNDPNKGFMGSPFSHSGNGLVVYPNGLKKMTIKYLGSYKNLTGCSLNTIKKNLRQHKLVMVWVYGLGFNWSHTVALTGYDNKGFYYNDPYTGQKAKISYSSFKTKWYANGTMAMTY